MITVEQQKQGSEFLKTLIEKSWNDKDFKNQLIQNPKEKIAELTGKNLASFSKEKQIIVEDQSNPSFIYLNIPPKYDDIELTAEELEVVSGGESGNADCNGWNPIKWVGYYAHQLYDYIAN